MVLKTIVTGVYNPSYNVLGPHLVVTHLKILETSPGGQWLRTALAPRVDRLWRHEGQAFIVFDDGSHGGSSTMYICIYIYIYIFRDGGFTCPLDPHSAYLSGTRWGADDEGRARLQRSEPGDGGACPWPQKQKDVGGNPMGETHGKPHGECDLFVYVFIYLFMCLFIYFSIYLYIYIYIYMLAFPHVFSMLRRMMRFLRKFPVKPTLQWWCWVQ